MNNNKRNIFKHVRIFNNFLSRGKIPNISLNVKVRNFLLPGKVK